MENEKWIGDGSKTGDVDRRAPPEQGEASALAEVVTVIKNGTLKSTANHFFTWQQRKSKLLN